MQLALTAPCTQALETLAASLIRQPQSSRLVPAAIRMQADSVMHRDQASQVPRREACQRLQTQALVRG